MTFYPNLFIFLVALPRPPVSTICKSRIGKITLDIHELDVPPIGQSILFSTCVIYCKRSCLFLRFAVVPPKMAKQIRVSTQIMRLFVRRGWRHLSRQQTETS